ncbi:ester cyclase [Streptomyces sp. NPDC005791]|uniref:ester cyclase n=1 Tax=unclassified Streptomyces TaxID=2593676 RepID=UPI0033D77472
MRTAFEGCACERRALISQGDYVGARTCMSGRFTAPFEASSLGAIAPNGQLMCLELINHFRYHENGRLAEKWVQYDNVGLLRQLGVDLTEGY